MSPERHRGQELLDDPGFAEGDAEKVEQGAEVRVPDADLEHGRAAGAVERLHHDLAVLGAEGLDRVPVAGDEGRGHQLREIHDEQLLRRVADAARIVDDERLRLNALEEMRRRHIGEIEGRVLPEQHDVDAGEIDEPRLAEALMVALDVLDRQRFGHRLDAGAVEPQPLGRVMQQAMAARLGLEQQCEGRSRRRCGCVRSDPSARRR